MFGFLKKKLKDAVQKFTGNVEEEIQEEQVEQVQEEDISEAEQEILEEELEKQPEEEIPAEEENEGLEPEEEAEQILEEAVEEVEEEPEEEEQPEEEKQPEEEEEESEPQKEELLKDIDEVQEEIEEDIEQLEDEQEKQEFIEKAKEDIKHDLEQIEESEIETDKEQGKDIEEIIEHEKQEKEEIEEELEEIEREIKPKKKSFLGKLFGKKEEKEEKISTEPKKQQKEEEKKSSTFTKFKETFTKKTLSKEKFDELFWELELTLLENNVAVEVIEKIKENLKKELTTGRVSRVGIDTIILQTLKTTIEEILSTPSPNLIKIIKAKKEKPYVITFVGVNGSGKTTNLAKFAYLCKQNGLTVVVAACDTFRAAAIQQIENHTNNLGIKLIKQDYGADAAAVAFDAIKHAQARNADVVLIDTAGRLHSNTNLMDELSKIIRIAKPDYKIFVGEATTGNDCIEQATQFNEAVQIDGSILSKADVDDKGGAAISLSHVTGKPILYLGVGQEYKDLEKFDPKKILAMIGL